MRHLFLFVLLSPCLWSQRFPETGNIGIYDRTYQGTMLGNGERFDGNQPVAGHPTLPVGSYATVYNPANRKSIQVRIVQRIQTAPLHIMYVSEAVERTLAPFSGSMIVYLGNAPATLPIPSQITPVGITRPIATPLPYLPLTATPNRLFSKGLTTYQTSVKEGITSSGAPYSPTGYYAAHRFLPFGTKVKVVNVSNGRSVVVEINDRGPIAFPERMLDLNYQAGVELGMLERGKLETEMYIESPIASYYYQMPFDFEAWTIQVSSSASQRWADNYVKRLGSMAFVVPFMVNGRQTYRVFYGRFDARAKAIEEANRLKRKGYTAAFAKFLLEEHPNLIDFRPFGGPAPRP